MSQDKKLARYRRKRCLHCKDLFDPNPRAHHKQCYCSAVECQRVRQRANEKNWRKRNPECVAYQQQQSRAWNKKHPEYSKKRRKENPVLARRNKEFTQKRMRRLRAQMLFDKSKLILLQLLGNTDTSCYLSRNAGWLFLRLTKTRSFLKRDCLRHNCVKFKRIKSRMARLPTGALYDLSNALEPIHRRKRYAG
jgi:hypothetical protein